MIFKKFLHFTILLISGFIFLTSCPGGSSNSSIPPIEFPEFTNVINQTGIGNVGFLGQTAAWGDYNNDGCLDLFVANTDFSPPNVFLFRNNCNGTFSDSTVGSGIADIPLRSASWADFDNDGFLDLIVGTIEVSKPPILYRNLDGTVFSDVSDERGITLEGSTTKQVVWADYDLDGFVDFFQSGLGASFLYHNQGDGTFMELTEESGIDLTSSNSALWFDFNNDGFLDLFLARSTSNQFYLNNGDSTFTDITDVAGLTGVSNSSSVACCSADFNNDGLVDLYLANGGERNALYRNNGDGTFSDITSTSGTGDVGDARTCAWVDIDGDGFIDLLTTNHTADTKVFRNLGNERFIDVASQLDVELPIDVFAAPWGDFNSDGFMDGFLTGHIGNALLQNGGTSSNFLVLELVGDGVSTNRSAIGARVEILSSLGMQVREVSGGKGRCEQDMLPVHFGAGMDKTADIIIRWNAEDECSFQDVNIDGGRIFVVFQENCRIEPA